MKGKGGDVGENLIREGYREAQVLGTPVKSAQITNNLSTF